MTKCLLVGTTKLAIIANTTQHVQIALRSSYSWLDDIFLVLICGTQQNTCEPSRNITTTCVLYKYIKTLIKSQ